MAGRTARLSLWLVLGVVLAHGVALEWVADHLQPLSALRPMADPMFTRVLQPEARPAVVPRVAASLPAKPRPPRVKASALPAPRPVASAPQPAAAPEAAAEAESETAAEDTAAQAAGPAASAPAAPASQATADAAAAAASAPVTDLESWPADTRLTYRLGGQFRSGELHGKARVQWQREADSYQVRVEVDVTLLAHMALISQGQVAPQGLVPRMYEEVRRGKRRAARLEAESITLEGGRTAARPDGVQDTASQFVELAHRFATGRDKLEVGKTVTFWMARPNGVDLWTYDIVERETLQTPGFGAIEAYRLKPRRITNPRGNITAEMWYAPTLQYLPVRIRIAMGEDTFVDLMVDKIEMR